MYKLLDGKAVASAVKSELKSKVIELKKTKKPGIGIMKVMNNVVNQDGVVVLTHEDTVMIFTREQ